jgi:hypothetical protein
VATRSHPHPRPHALDAGALVEALQVLIDPSMLTQVIGVEAHDEHVDLHVAPLPHDDRAGAAGLFGMRAGPGWCAVAMSFAGRARHLDDGHVIGRAGGLLVVDRDGGVASRLHVDGDDPLLDEPLDPGHPQGLTVDALHRILGLPSPGRPPATPLVTLALWSQLVIVHTLEHECLSWARAVALHPGHPHAHHGGHGGAHLLPEPPDVGASVETVVEATLRTEGELDWARLHRRACRGRPLVDLSAQEAAWMDPTLVARWMLGGLPDVELAAQVLVAHDQHHTARCMRAVGRAVVAAVGPVNHG